MDTAGAWKPFQQCPVLFLLSSAFQEATPITSQPHRIIRTTFSCCWLECGSGRHFVSTASFYHPASEDSAFPKLTPSPYLYIKNLSFKNLSPRSCKCLFDRSADMVFNSGKRVRSRVEASLSGMSEPPWKSPN